MFIASVLCISLLTRYYEYSANNKSSVTGKGNLLNQMFTVCKSAVCACVSQTVGAASSSLNLSPSPMFPDPFMCVLDSTLCCG